ncbi:MAG: hypothetical protein ACYC4Q_00745 [Victivallaceae bacterium]
MNKIEQSPIQNMEEIKEHLLHEAELDQHHISTVEEETKLLGAATDDDSSLLHRH